MPRLFPINPQLYSLFNIVFFIIDHPLQAYIKIAQAVSSRPVSLIFISIHVFLVVLLQLALSSMLRFYGL